MPTPRKKSLADALANPPTRKLASCNVGRAITEHKEGKVIAETVANLRWSADALSRVLGEYGIVVSATAVRNHRRGDCACARASA